MANPASINDDVRIPETKVLAIASHVSYGYVGNTMATFVMQVLGCEVAAINTVNFSNHTGYRRVKGRRTPPDEITALYAGLKAAFLTDFDVLLSGYIPSAAAVDAVAAIAGDLRRRRGGKAGGFFWVLDPVMGDQGRLYVDKDIVGRYAACVRAGGADLILPNGFEAELLTGRAAGSVRTLADVASVVGDLHRLGAPHVIVTSVRLQDGGGGASMVVAGSSRRSDGSARVWRVEVPVLDCFFSGTGDMFAALMVARLREAATAAGLLDTPAWMPADGVAAADTPLARATETVLSSMQTVLEKTMAARDRDLANDDNHSHDHNHAEEDAAEEEDGERVDAATRAYLAATRASEIRLVRNWRDLVEPRVRFRAEAVV